MIGQVKDAREAQLREKAVARLAVLEAEHWANRIYHFCEGDIWQPNPQQKRLLEGMKDPRYRTFTMTGSNQKGKTTIGLIVAICYMAGEWLWSGEKIPFPHKEPRVITYTGQGWETHIAKTVEPDFKKLWPKCRPLETHKNNQGIDAHVIDKITKSEMFIMSNNQESIAFEGDKADLRIWDEPPKRANRVAGGRGLMARNGKELFVATNLNEAWFAREVIKARLANGEPDLSIFNVHGSIWDNVSKCRCGEFILREEIVNDKFVAHCPKCGPVMDYQRYGLTVEGVEKYKSTLKESEIDVRIEGGDFLSYTRVLPNFERNVHCVNRFKIPLNWITDISIDFHPSKPWAVLFEATGPNDFHYMYDFIHEKGNPKYIAEEIIRKVRANETFVNSITIDPLSKGDENAHIEAETVYKIMEKVFRAYNYKLDTASKDKDNGIALLNDSFLSENGMPSRYIFKDMGIVIEQLEDWMYDPETFKPEKTNDDFCEVAYRIALRNTEWDDPYDRVSRLARLPLADMGQVAFG
ncbi:MAG: hypothetical protein IMZ61_04660 [Planctomycetes bacterium]|nr:hypothetical protein [Planctomycetota bacterium]